MPETVVYTYKASFENKKDYERNLEVLNKKFEHPITWKEWHNKHKQTGLTNQ